MKKILLSTLLLTGLGVNAQNVNIPDANLKNALLGTASVNTNGDTEIQLTEAQSALGYLDVSNQNISNMTGLEKFTSVYAINLSNNNLTSVTFTDMNTSLSDLDLTGNQLSGGMNLSGLQGLQYLQLIFCNLTSFNPSLHPSLIFANCAYNSMTSVDFSNNPMLEGIDMGNCSNLSNLVFSATDNPNMTTFRVNDCPLLTQDLNLSGFSSLALVVVSNSGVTGLNVANGNNTNFVSPNGGFNGLNTSNLDCITVDDVSLSTNSGDWLKDAADSYSLDCNAVPPADTIYVNPIATGNNDGTSWADAYLDARDAFNNSNDNDNVWIAQGTYVRNTTDRNAVFGWITDSLHVYGGFSGDGTETSIDQRDWDAYPTIFSGDIGVVGDSTDNVYTVFTGSLGVVSANGRLTYSYVDGIKVTGGNADVDSYPDFNSVAGGILPDYLTDHTVWKNIEVYDCYAKIGAAMSLYNYDNTQLAKLELENVIIRNNAGRSSVALQVRSLTGSNVELKMKNCLVAHNIVLDPLPNGGLQEQGTLMFLGCNQSGFNAEFTNNTFANNVVSSQSTSVGSIRTYLLNGSGIATFTNNIFYGNSVLDITSAVPDGTLFPWQSVTMTNNLLENGHDFAVVTETNTTTADPLFTDAANADYRLNLTSPSIDAGTQSGITVPMFDLAGNPRVYGSEIDLGAYENQGSNTGGNIGIEEVAGNSSLILYPNPTTGLITIKSKSKVESVIVLNGLGQVVAQTQNTTSLDLTNLPRGVHFVRVTTTNGNSTQKLILN